MIPTSNESARRLLTAVGLTLALVACSGSSDADSSVAGPSPEQGTDVPSDDGTDPDDTTEPTDSVDDSGTDDGSGGPNETDDVSDQTSADEPLSTPTVEVTAELADGELLSAAELSPDGASFAVAIAAAPAANEARISIHDAVTGELSDTIGLPGSAEILDLFWWPGGLSMISLENDIITVDPADGTVIRSVPLQQCNISDAVELDVERAVLYTWSGGGELCRLDLASGEELRIESSDGLLVDHAAVDADGALLAVTTTDQDFTFSTAVHDATTLEPTGESLDAAGEPVWGHATDRFVAGTRPPAIGPDGVDLTGDGVSLASAAANVVVTIESGDVGDPSTYRVHDFRTGATVASFVADAQQWTLSTSLDGSRVVVGDTTTGTTRIFEV